MSEDVIDTAAKAVGLPSSPSRTTELTLQLVRPARSSPHGPPSVAEIQSAARNEFARTVEDVLARRLRLLLLDARKSAEDAPEVARQLAAELRHSEEWADDQAREYRALVDRYTLNDPTD
jgi:glycerol-3-phosphate dehydrogenase